MMLQRSPKPLTKSKRRVCHALSAAPLTNGSPVIGSPRYKRFVASTVRNQRWRARLKQRKNDPGRIIGVMLHASELEAISLAMSPNKPRDRDKPIYDRQWHDDIASQVRAFVVAELKKQKLVRK